MIIVICSSSWRVFTCLLLLGVSVVCFDTGGAGNGPTEATNGIVELGRRAASAYRNPATYILRMLLIAGGLDAPIPNYEAFAFGVTVAPCMPDKCMHWAHNPVITGLTFSFLCGSLLSAREGHFLCRVADDSCSLWRLLVCLP